MQCWVDGCIHALPLQKIHGAVLLGNQPLFHTLMPSSGSKDSNHEALRSGNLGGHASGLPRPNQRLGKDFSKHSLMCQV